MSRNTDDGGSGGGSWRLLFNAVPLKEGGHAEEDDAGKASRFSRTGEVRLPLALTLGVAAVFCSFLSEFPSSGSYISTSLEY